MAAYIRPEDYNKVVDNKYTLRELCEYAYRGALLLKRERMKIDVPNATINCDDSNLKPPFLNNPKTVEVDDTQPRIEVGNQICPYNKYSGSDSTARDAMLTTNIDPISQKRFENLGSYENEMTNNLEAPIQKKRKRIQSMLEASFQRRNRIESYVAICNAMLDCKLAKGNPVSSHVKKMTGFFNSLEKLGFPISQELAIGIILGNLPDEYDSFINNFYEYPHNKKLNELHEMLKSFEITIRKENPTNANLLIKKEKGKKQARKKCKGKENGEIKNLNKSDPPSLQPQRGAKSEDVCNFCNEFGHWKRNCKKYLEDLKK